MIRIATQDDRLHVIRLGIEFNDLHYDVPVSDHKLNDWWNLHTERGVILCSDTGYLSALIVPDPIRDWTALVETAWYDTNPANGVALLKAAAKHGRTLFCDEMRMTTLTTTPARAVYLLQRLGYEEIERSHRLIL